MLMRALLSSCLLLFFGYTDGDRGPCSSALDDVDACAERPDCFPHWDGIMLTCRKAQEVDCRMRKEADGKKLMLFASTGLVNNPLKRALRELVVRLPDEAWGEVGAAVKWVARQQE